VLSLQFEKDLPCQISLFECKEYLCILEQTFITLFCLDYVNLLIGWETTFFLDMQAQLIITVFKNFTMKQRSVCFEKFEQGLIP
jgi:hypothetical protein